jgi:UDP-3-O-[3-hydroxymyristoyl] glucosamine N-acyltransferase
MEQTVNALAQLLKGSVEGDGELALRGFAGIEEAVAGQLSFLANPSYEDFLYKTAASAVLVDTNFVAKSPIPNGTALLRVENPYAAMATLMQAFGEQAVSGPEVHPSAFVDDTAELGEGARIGALAVVEAGAVIGARTVVGPGVIVGARCVIGADCILQAGAIVGADGFGFAPQNGAYTKVPQLGNVVIGDHCEIGAGTTIDRATLGSTVLGEGVKLDNLIQVAHNVSIGAHTVVAAQTGIAGSAKVGAHCMIGGQVGIGGHIKVADRTHIAAKSGVSASVLEPGQILQGFPAIPIRKHRRIQIAMRKLESDLASLHNRIDSIARIDHIN